VIYDRIYDVISMTLSPQISMEVSVGVYGLINEYTKQQSPDLSD